MLTKYLKLCIENLNSLIEITQSDIDDIKVASHQNQFNRVKLKEELLTSFENYKNYIDLEILKLQQNRSDDGGIDSILNDDEQMLLGEMKEKLLALKELNRRYAKIVLAVSSFYNALLESMLPKDSKEMGHGYDLKRIKAAAFLEIKG